jgi:hypothetical protein
MLYHITLHYIIHYIILYCILYIIYYFILYINSLGLDKNGPTQPNAFCYVFRKLVDLCRQDLSFSLSLPQSVQVCNLKSRNVTEVGKSCLKDSV